MDLGYGWHTTGYKEQYLLLYNFEGNPNLTTITVGMICEKAVIYIKKFTQLHSIF